MRSSSTATADGLWRDHHRRDGWLADEVEIDLRPGGDARFRTGDERRTGWVEEVARRPTRLTVLVERRRRAGQPGRADPRAAGRRRHPRARASRHARSSCSISSALPLPAAPAQRGFGPALLAGPPDGRHPGAVFAALADGTRRGLLADDRAPSGVGDRARRGAADLPSGGRQAPRRARRRRPRRAASAPDARSSTGSPPPRSRTRSAGWPRSARVGPSAWPGSVGRRRANRAQSVLQGRLTAEPTRALSGARVWMDLTA